MTALKGVQFASTNELAFASLIQLSLTGYLNESGKSYQIKMTKGEVKVYGERPPECPLFTARSREAAVEQATSSWVSGLRRAALPLLKSSIKPKSEASCSTTQPVAGDDRLLSPKAPVDFMKKVRVFDNAWFAGMDFSNLGLGATEDSKGRADSRFSFRNARFSKCIFDNVFLLGADLRGASFAGCELVGLDGLTLKYLLSSGASLSGATFRNCTFTDVDHPDAALDDVSFVDCTLKNVRLPKARMNRATFRQCTFHDTEIDHAVGAAVALQECTFVNASFCDSILHRLKCTGCDFVQIWFHRADLTGAKFDNTEFHDGALDCILRNATFVSINQRIRGQNPCFLVRTTGADWQGATVVSSYFPGVMLDGRIDGLQFWDTDLVGDFCTSAGGRAITIDGKPETPVPYTVRVEPWGVTKTAIHSPVTEPAVDSSHVEPVRTMGRLKPVPILKHAEPAVALSHVTPAEELTPAEPGHGKIGEVRRYNGTSKFLSRRFDFSAMSK